MRKYVALVAVVFFAGLIAAPAALAGTVSLSLQSTTPSTTVFTISGTYAAGVPATSFSAAGDTYAISFTILTNPSADSTFQSLPDSPDPLPPHLNDGGLFTVNTAFSISLNGGASMSLGTFTVEFDDTALGNLGGVIFCFDTTGCSSHTGWDLIGQQLFTGNLSNPSSIAFIDTPNAQINQTMSGYFINGSQTFPFGNAPTPEPAPLLLLGTGLLGVGILARKKLHIV